MYLAFVNKLKKVTTFPTCPVSLADSKKNKSVFATNHETNISNLRHMIQSKVFYCWPTLTIIFTGKISTPLLIHCSALTTGDVTIA